MDGDDLVELGLHKSNSISILVLPKLTLSQCGVRSPYSSTLINEDTVALVAVNLSHTIGPSHGHYKGILANCACH